MQASSQAGVFALAHFADLWGMAGAAFAVVASFLAGALVRACGQPEARLGRLLALGILAGLGFGALPALFALCGARGFGMLIMWMASLFVPATVLVTRSIGSRFVAIDPAWRGRQIGRRLALVPCLVLGSFLSSALFGSLASSVLGRPAYDFGIAPAVPALPPDRSRLPG